MWHRLDSVHCLLTRRNHYGDSPLKIVHMLHLLKGIGTVLYKSEFNVLYSKRFYNVDIRSFCTTSTCIFRIFMCLFNKVFILMLYVELYYIDVPYWNINVMKHYFNCDYGPLNLNWPLLIFFQIEPGHRPTVK